jgi:hypothetical protein
MRYVMVAIVATMAIVALMDAGLRASEEQDCVQMQSWKERGHSVVPPQWCFDEGYLVK